MQLFRLSALFTAMTTLTGCFLKSGASEILVSSERSDYSPVVTLRASVRVTDSVHVHVKRARVLAPGEVFEGMGAIAGKLVMQALLASTSTDGVATNRGATEGTSNGVSGSGGMVANRGSANGATRLWTERAASVPVALVDSLVMGRPREVADLDFVMPLPAGVDAKNS